MRLGSITRPGLIACASRSPVLKRIDRLQLAVPDANTLFLHPSALGGPMLGLSRPTQAWQWSGHPERVEPRPGA
jgi:hypothetical protein